MADVAPGRRLPGDGENRGQLMLVAALGLAVLFVTLALIVNTAIFTENLATRGSDVGGGTEAVRYQDAASTGVAGLIEFANYHENASYVTLRTELEAGVEAIDNRTGRQLAMSDRAAEARLAGSVNGTRVAQTTTGRNVSNVSGAADWTVASEVNHTRSFSLNVTDTAELVDFGLAGAFRVVVEKGSATWRLNVTQTAVGSDVIVAGADADGDEFRCSATPAPVVVDLTAGTVGGVPCDGLEYAAGLSRPYNVTVENGDNVVGTYSLVVDDDDLAGAPGPHLAAVGAGQPLATHAVYAANLTVTYQTPQLYYNTTVRVAPGEPDG